MGSLLYHAEGDSVDYTPAAAKTAGDPILLPDGRVGVPANDIAANALGALRVSGLFRASAASGTTFAKGDEVYWDASAGLAVAKALTLDPAADFRLGVAAAAKVSGTTHVVVALNAERSLHRFVQEFDCDTGAADSAEKVLIPASANPHGLLIVGVWGVVTEVFGGATQDQGVVTVEDEDDNAICTLTPSDAGADVVGDVVVGHSLPAASTGAAVKTVAAGKAVQGQVTQVTSGAGAAGKMKVYVLAIPLV